MQWRSEADSKVKGAPPESQDVTMPGSVIDLRTLSECGMYNERVLFLRFENNSIPEILFRPAQSRWLSEFHFWLKPSRSSWRITKKIQTQLASRTT